MKRITRVIGNPPALGKEDRVWIDATGHWTRDEKLAFVFDDAEAEKRVKRIPHAETEDVPSDANPE